MSQIRIGRISGLLAFALSAVYSTLALFLPVFLHHDSIELIFHRDFVITYWSIVFSLLFPYVIEKLEGNEKALEQIKDEPFRGLTIFGNAGELVDALIEKTVGAESVSTLNFSPPAGVSAELDRYFREVNRYLTGTSSALVSFRSIASIETEAKARGLIDRTKQFEKHPTLSLACFKTQHFERLMCYHVVFKSEQGYVFVYPPIALTGMMDSFMIISTEIAELMKRQFDIAWEHSEAVLLGGLPQLSGLEFMVGKYPGIATQPNFGTLKKCAA